MLSHSIKLDRFLSFGESEAATPLRALNLVIGPNGSGKSNLLEAFNLLRNAPRDLGKPIREGGGLGWLWKGRGGTAFAHLGVVVANREGGPPLMHNLALGSNSPGSVQLVLLTEQIADAPTGQDSESRRSYFKSMIFQAELRAGDQLRPLRAADYDSSQSILAQRRDPEQYPEITHLSQSHDAIRLYRDWSFGRHSPTRRPQDAAMPNQWLESDGSNLGLILSRFEREPTVKRQVLVALRKLYEGIENFFVQTEGGAVQVFVQEGEWTIPALRLSDGTLRYLCLLAILCHPRPPPLACIEGPDLKPWLEKYRLGTLSTRGDIGGTRW